MADRQRRADAPRKERDRNERENQNDDTEIIDADVDEFFEADDAIERRRDPLRRLQ